MDKNKELANNLYHTLKRLPNEPNGIIYHYTPADKFIYIVGEKLILKFTRYDCLSDYTEGQEINSIFVKVCKELLASKIIPQQFYDYINNTTAKNEITIQADEYLKFYNIPTSYTIEADPYLCCFTNDSDSLPMWNYYLKNEKYQGYALGFYIEDMKPINTNFKINIYEVIYDYSKKNEKLRRYIEEVYLDTSLDYEKKLNHITKFLSNYRMLFKNPAFKCENEIRAIVLIPKNQTEKIEYEMRNGTIKPFVKIEFEKIALQHIVLSPALNNELGEKIMSEYLKKMGYSVVDIESSTIPIRY